MAEGHDRFSPMWHTPGCHADRARRRVPLPPDLIVATVRPGTTPRASPCPQRRHPYQLLDPSAEAKLPLPFPKPSRETTSALLLAPRSASARHRSTLSNAAESSADLKHRP
jgi:hypothetical protein